jgi:hypothetical protein
MQGAGPFHLQDCMNMYSMSFFSALDVTDGSFMHMINATTVTYLQKLGVMKNVLPRDN